MNTLYERFKGGETLHVRTEEGMTFYAEPVDFAGIIIGATVKKAVNKDGKRVNGRKRFSMSDWDMQDWFSFLTEVEG